MRVNDTSFNILLSYAWVGKGRTQFFEYMREQSRLGKMDLMIDSGAFSKFGAQIKGSSDMDWVTVSPKTKLDFNWGEIDELKFLYGWFDDGYLVEVGKEASKKRIECYIQPTADHDNRFDALPAIEFAKKHPDWTLSLQFHKLLNIR